MIAEDSTLLGLTTEEIFLLGDFVKLAKEAKEASELIAKKYKFEGDCKKIQVYNDGHNEEFVTSDGFWHGVYLGVEYLQECSIEEIYKLYRDQYLYEENYFSDGHYKSQARIAANFKEFVKHTRIMK